MLQTQHAVLPQATHDEFAREEFCGSLRKFFTETLWPGTRDVYQGQQLPAFEREHGREPASAREVRAAMENSFYFRASNLLGRVAQELLWDTVGESVERQLPELREKAKPRADAKGSLRLNPELEIPRYIDSVDIHVMPGNFHNELCEDDVYAGALYDRGVYYFAYGGMGADNDKLGLLMAQWLKDEFPDFQPKRILDMGCGNGLSTLPWKDIYPDAELQAIDVAAPMLRYAHARAEAYGKEVHFSQQNAVATDFPDESFDLVFSCLVTHEMPVHVTKAMLRESHRLLKKGGLVLADGGAAPTDGAEAEFFGSWFNNNNNEPFQTGLRRLDMKAALSEAGFPEDNYFASGVREAAYLGGMRRGQKNLKGGGAGYLGAIKS
jgi:SAM-dependent methyltransferase